MNRSTSCNHTPTSLATCRRECLSLLLWMQRICECRHSDWLIRPNNSSNRFALRIRGRPDQRPVGKPSTFEFTSLDQAVPTARPQRNEEEAPQRSLRESNKTGSAEESVCRPAWTEDTKSASAEDLSQHKQTAIEQRCALPGEHLKTTTEVRRLWQQSLDKSVNVKIARQK